MMKSMRHSKDLGIGGAMARWYDKNTRSHRMAEMRAYAEEVARRLNEGADVLEVAPGPGYLTIALAAMGKFNVTGMDVSQDFVDIATRNARDAGVHVDFRQGNVSSMPFEDSSFDFIVCSAAFKNFKEPLAALKEMHRVLKPDGTALIIDMRRDASSKDIDNMVKESGEKGLEAFWLKLTFKYFLRRGAYTEAEILDLVSKTSFREH